MIEKIQERLLRFQLIHFYSPYEELLTKAVKKTMLISRLKVVCTEIYKTINGIYPEYMKEIFAKYQIRSSLRFPNNLDVPRLNQATNGTKCLRMLAPKTWKNIGFVSGI